VKLAPLRQGAWPSIDQFPGAALRRPQPPRPLPQGATSVLSIAPTIGGPMMPPMTAAVLTMGSTTAWLAPRQMRAPSTISGGLDAAPAAVDRASAAKPAAAEARSTSGSSIVSAPDVKTQPTTWSMCSSRR
jgi:hypothetical protein